MATSIWVLYRSTRTMVATCSVSEFNAHSKQCLLHQICNANFLFRRTVNDLAPLRSFSNVGYQSDQNPLDRYGYGAVFMDVQLDVNRLPPSVRCENAVSNNTVHLPIDVTGNSKNYFSLMISTFVRILSLNIHNSIQFNSQRSSE